MEEIVRDLLNSRTFIDSLDSRSFSHPMVLRRPNWAQRVPRMETGRDFATVYSSRYANEQARIASFRDFPVACEVNKVEISRAGFFY